MRTIANGRRCRIGATVVEMVPVILVCILCFLAIFEYARFLMVRTSTQAACREAARLATVSSYTVSTSVIQDRAYAVLGTLRTQFNPALTASSFAVYEYNPSNVTDYSLPWTGARFGDPIAVRVSGNYTPLFATLLRMPTSITITEMAIMTCEAN